ncbi:hypothetical protein B0G84_1950 [Paraburkholderia sp. BL8N3]|nr:hypothetical protein [Paraburkholderia sp. BL8N3]TCK43608.1 hypothetical protein B0G84_1950 [Paraburkholderia sp. BL8N3]
MNESLVAIVVGSSTLLIAALMVIGHCIREHRRRHLTQRLKHVCWWDTSGSRR